MGNSHSLNQFYDGVMRIWYKWINRRSQYRSYTWEEFKEMIGRYEIPRPKVTEVRRKPTNVQQISLNYAWCGSETYRGAGCEKTARPDLRGGNGVIRYPTVTTKDNAKDRGS